MFTRALTGARMLWIGCAPAATVRVYYANHNSHGDFALIWSCLPDDLRERTRPVAGSTTGSRAGFAPTSRSASSARC